MGDYDAIIIGAGHNGLICALNLARHGWRVLVLERGKEVGGGLRSAQLTAPGFHHDRYATNLGFFAGSPIYRELKAEFDALGVRLLRSERTYASIHGNRAIRVYTDVDRTLQDIDAIQTSEREGWRRLVEFYRRVAPKFLPLFYVECPSREMWQHVLRLAVGSPGDALRLASSVRQSSAGFASSFFQTPEMKGVLEAWGYHLDFGPHVAGGGIFAFVAAMSAHLNGMPIVEGGAGRISEALRTLIERAGGVVHTNAEVNHIIVKRGQATAVQTIGGEQFAARRAIVANVTTKNLFGGLIAPENLDSRFFQKTQRFRYCPGTFIIHLALDRPLNWRVTDELAQFNYVHLNATESDIDETYRASLKGLLPVRPLLVVSQTTPIDPSRAPAGQHVVRIHVRSVPGQIAGDQAGAMTSLNWRDAQEPFTERVLDLVEDHAPGLRASIIGQAVESPVDIEHQNPNFVGGDCVSGSHHITQNFMFRPFAGWSNYKTPIRDLYMIGASTWPGGGINGGSGYLLAKRLSGTG
jgi:phytoene dehydrogenase-like protein